LIYFTKNAIHRYRPPAGAEPQGDADAVYIFEMILLLTLLLSLTLSLTLTLTLTLLSPGSSRFFPVLFGSSLSPGEGFPLFPTVDHNTACPTAAFSL
jgi:hypothetical protein